MKINSKNKLLWIVFLMTVMVFVSAVAVSAAPITKDASLANENFASTVSFTWSGGNEAEAIALLREAMTASESDCQVSLTLNSDMNISAAGTHVVGKKDNTPAGELIITGNGNYGIILGSNTNLDFKGNVTFENVKLERNSTASFYNGSFIFVTEGTGKFGNPSDTSTYGNVVNPNSATNTKRVSVAGKNLEIYSGYYYAIGANHRLSGVNIENPTIVFGGNAVTQVLAARGLYTDANSKVIGNSSLTISGNAQVAGDLTAGHYCASANASTHVEGDSTLTVNSNNTSTIMNFHILGYSTNGGDDAEFSFLKAPAQELSDYTNSTYTINLVKGAIRAHTDIFYMAAGKKADVKHFNIVMNVGTSSSAFNFNSGSAVHWGLKTYSEAGSMTFGGEKDASKKSSFTATFNNTTFYNSFCGGSYIGAGTQQYKIVDDITRNYIFNGTVFKSDVVFGSYVADSDAKAVHAGDTTVTLNGAVTFPTNEKMLYGGSYLASNNAEHSGNSTIIYQANWQRVNRTMFGGSKLVASGSIHSGDSKIIIANGKTPGTTAATYFGGSHLTAVGTTHSGKSSIVSEKGSSNGYLYATMYGGSLIECSVATDSTAKMVHSGHSSITLESGFSYSGTCFYGGSKIDAQYGEHSANSEINVKAQYKISNGINYGGSHLCAIGAMHTGNSKLILNTANIVYGNSYGGSRFDETNIPAGTASCMQVGTPEKPVTLTVIVDSPLSTSLQSSGRIFAGCHFGVGDAVIYGDTHFILNNGVLNHADGHGAGSYSANTLTDTDTNDGITGGFGQIGNAYYTVNGGTVASACAYPAGVNVNINGNVYVTVEGGNFSGIFSSLSSKSGNPVSVKGNLITSIRGGNFTNSYIHNGCVSGDSISVVDGTLYFELVNDGKGAPIVFSGTSYIRLYGYLYESVNRMSFVDNIYCKVVGDVPIKSGDSTLWTWNQTGYISTVNTCLDFTQATAASFGVPTYSGITVLRPIDNINNVTITNADKSVTFNPSNKNLGSLSDLNGWMFNWTYTANGGKYSATYEQLTAFDGYTEFKNSPKFVDAINKNGISTSTTQVVLKYGNFYSNAYNLSTGATGQLSQISANYSYKGFSIRVGELALRCTAKISKDFFDEFNINGDGNNSLADGYKISSVGILVSLDDKEYLSRDNADINALAWKDGVFYTSNGVWVDITEEDGSVYYYFSAAVTGYGDVNGVNREFAETEVFFRAYIELKNDEGNSYIVYLDNPAADGENNNYGTSLAETALDVWENKSEWVNSTQERLESVAAILASTSTNYNVTFKKETGCGIISVYPVKDTENGTEYDVVVKAKAGYVVTSIKVGDTTFDNLTGNKVTVVLNGDTTVEAAYSRTASAVLDARRSTVMNKMSQITTTKFRYTNGYDSYVITSGNTPPLYAYDQSPSALYTNTEYLGMAYSNIPTLSFDAFIQDYTTGPDENGVYTVKDTGIVSNGKTYIWGNNCADTVYWSWSTVSSSITCTVTDNYNDKFGCVYVGDYEVKDEDFDDEGYWVSKEAVCLRNGRQVMYDAYAMLQPADALVNDGHAILVKRVIFGYTDGVIDYNKSYVIFYEQNVSYEEKGNANGIVSLSSCESSATMYFSTLFNLGYIPMTCAELADENCAVEASVVADTLANIEFDKNSVTQGQITANYYISKVSMEITDSEGNVQTFTRYRDETNPKSVDMSWFAQTYAVEYADIEIYKNNVLDLQSLPSGTTNCKVTVYLGNGYSEVVRDFNFVK